MKPLAGSWRAALPYLVAVGISLVVAAVVAQTSARPNTGFTDAAAVLTIAGLVAVGIERTLEVGWTLIGQAKSAWWPLNEFAEEVGRLEASVTDSAGSLFNDALTRLETARGAVDTATDTWKRIDAQIQQLETRRTSWEQQRDQILALAPGNQRFRLLASASSQVAGELKTRYGQAEPQIAHAAAVASQVTAGAADFVATFKDNPSRRVISIWAGGLIGMTAAGILGLDIFQAAAGATIGGWRVGQQELLPFLGVALTGMVLGLGADPTHEVIRVLQEWKKSKKVGNDLSVSG